MTDPHKQALTVHFQPTNGLSAIYTEVSAEAAAGPVPAQQLLLKGLFAPIGKVGII